MDLDSLTRDEFIEVSFTLFAYKDSFKMSRDPATTKFAYFYCRHDGTIEQVPGPLTYESLLAFTACKWHRGEMGILNIPAMEHMSVAEIDAMQNSPTAGCARVEFMPPPGIAIEWDTQ